MFKKGLTSVTFRKLSWEKVIQLACENELDGIEWGGDVHVMPGDMSRAAEVARRTRESGLEVFSYGSYYNLADPAEMFEPVCKTAEILGAPMIRVWGGRKSASETSSEELSNLARNFSQICRRAAAAGIRVSTEFHTRTFSDHAASCLRLLELTGEENAGTYWQPIQSPKEELESLDLILPHITYVHVFHWSLKGKRYSLKKGQKVWQAYAEKLRGIERGEHCAILEFVKGDRPRQLARDAETLKGIF